MEIFSEIYWRQGVTRPVCLVITFSLRTQQRVNFFLYYTFTVDNLEAGLQNLESLLNQVPGVLDYVKGTSELFMVRDDCEAESF